MKQNKIRSMKPVNTYYFNNNKNFGDILNVDILTKLMGLEIKHASPSQAELVCIGSLLESFLHGSGNLKLMVKKTLYPNLKIWGTGFIDKENSRIKRPANLKETFFKSVEAYAVRGSSTRTRLENILNKDLSSVVLGDPGLLASKLDYVKPGIEKKYKIGIVPHYIDKNNPIIQDFLNKNVDSVVLDILTEPETFLNKMMECEVVLSSAMHGLIAADSLGIPNQRVLFSDLIAGGDYKFKDYYSAFEVKMPKPYDLRKEELKISLPDIKNEYVLNASKVEKVQQRLIDAFPKFH